MASKLSFTPFNFDNILGDSASDIEAGKNAGMQTIGVSYGYSKSDKIQQADYVVDSVVGLDELLDKILSDATAA